MGSGKSTVGRLLADWLGVHLTDTDAQIEYETGLSIPEIFQTRGEAAFRLLEKDTVARAAKVTPSVIATGGGAFLDPENQAALKETGLTFYLRATAEHLFDRVRHARTRPLLHTPDPLQTLRTLLIQREPIYLTADYIVDVQTGNADHIVQKILTLRKKHPSLTTS
jgi:shikimate kinase